MANTLSLPNKTFVPKALVTDWFDPALPYVYFLGLDNSRTMYNIKGWRANSLPKTDDPALQRLCAVVGVTPSGVSIGDVEIPSTPVQLITRVRSDWKLYKHLEANGRVMWIPRRPVNILPDAI